MVLDSVIRSLIGRLAMICLASVTVIVSTVPVMAQLSAIDSAQAYGNWAYQVLDNPPDGVSFLTAAETGILNRVNQARGQGGLAPVIGSAELQAVARVHAIDMMQRGYFDHVNPEGRGPADRVGILDRSFIGTTGENIANMSGSIALDPGALAARFHTNWMNSSGHRRNILGGDWTSVGVGVAYREGAVVAVQVFGYEKARLEQPAPTRVRQGGRLNLSALGPGVPAQLFDLWDPIRKAAIGGPQQVSIGSIGVPAGVYNVRFYFAEGSGRFQIFTGPLLQVQ